MESAKSSTDAINAIVEKETWTIEDHQELLQCFFGETDAQRKFRAMLSELEGADPEPTGTAAVKIGIGRYMSCRFADALEILGNGTDNKDRRYFQAQCHKQLRQYDRALEEFERARDRGCDPLAINLEVVEIVALSGDLERAAKSLAKLEGKAGETAQYHYLRGLIDELGGFGERAAESYDKAREIDPTHVSATFRLAYYLDLHGEEEQAMELYRECIASPPVHVNALLNLAVLHEDAGDYEKAASYLRRILQANPNHARARLFLRDAEASTDMYYDEEQARWIARRNAVLDIPVTDFELSVRARNCLKKMNIRTLGDLVRTTEADLLGYKNFGETSLKEIKDMMTAKGLRIGQALEEESEFADVLPSAPANVNNEGVLGTAIEQIEFSVRARRALEGLSVRTLGELAAKTEAELLACRNFGQTSLHEVRQRLSEYGLTLREPS
jgi:DNA-directed RNA polymerase subunit alpha